MTAIETHIRPAPQLRLLVEAGLADHPTALDAWQQWSAAASLDDDIDGPTYALLPLVDANLQQRLGDRHGLLAGVYRRTWYLNQWAIESAEALVGACQAEDIPCAMTGDVALVQLAYRDLGARAISSVDLVCEPGDFARVRSVLMGRLETAQAATEPVATFAAPTPVDDLSVIVTVRPTGVGRTMALPLKAAGTRSVEPADLLIAALTASFATHSPLWLPDSALLLRRHGPSVDWARFAESARAGGIAARSAAALSYLERRYGIASPPQVSYDLSHSVAARWERRVLAARAKNGATSLAARATTNLAKAAYPLTSEHRRPTGRSRTQASADVARAVARSLWMRYRRRRNARPRS